VICKGSIYLHKSVVSLDYKVRKCVVYVYIYLQKSVVISGGSVWFPAFLCANRRFSAYDNGAHHQFQMP